MRAAPRGGSSPVRRSRASIATASSSGASLARARLGERAAVVAVVEHGGDVRRHALHAARADRLDPRLLDRVEQGAGRRALRRKAAMERIVVAGEAQRERIGEARGRSPPRAGWACAAARAAAPWRPPARRRARLVGREGDLELGMARDRPRAGRERALERLVRRLGLGGRLAVAGRLDVDGRHSGPSEGGGAKARFSIGPRRGVHHRRTARLPPAAARLGAIRPPRRVARQASKRPGARAADRERQKASRHGDVLLQFYGLIRRPCGRRTPSAGKSRRERSPPSASSSRRARAGRRRARSQ